jgi:hypothetical protein
MTIISLQDGYKYSVTAAMTVLLLRDLLVSAQPGTDRGPANFYFAHSETLLPLLAQLGIARDQVGGTGHPGHPRPATALRPAPAGGKAVADLTDRR